MTEEVQFRFVDETFEYKGRQLRVMRSPKGCQGCYFNQRKMRCSDQDQKVLGACSADQRADAEEVILGLDGLHLKITSSSIDFTAIDKKYTVDRYFHCTPGSVHKVVSFSNDTPLIMDCEGKDLIPIPEGDYVYLKVWAMSDLIASDGTPVHKGDVFIYMSSNSEVAVVRTNMLAPTFEIKISQIKYCD